MEILTRQMTLSHLLEIKDILLTEFDDFWTYNVFESELKNENSKYFVALIDNEIVGFAGIWNALRRNAYYKYCNKNFKKTYWYCK